MQEPEEPEPLHDKNGTEYPWILLPCRPTGGFLYADQLLAAIKDKHAAQGFSEVSSGSLAVWLRSGSAFWPLQHVQICMGESMHCTCMLQMTLYVEACESGSLFTGHAPALNAMGVYAVTAANGSESSWGTYCPGG